MKPAYHRSTLTLEQIAVLTRAYHGNRLTGPSRAYGGVNIIRLRALASCGLLLEGLDAKGVKCFGLTGMGRSWIEAWLSADAPVKTKAKTGSKARPKKQAKKQAKPNKQPANWR